MATETVQITLTKDEAGHLLSAVGHYRQYTDEVIAFAHRVRSRDSEAMEGLQAICRAMDRVAEQLLGQD